MFVRALLCLSLCISSILPSSTNYVRLLACCRCSQCIHIRIAQHSDHLGPDADFTPYGFQKKKKEKKFSCALHVSFPFHFFLNKKEDNVIHITALNKFDEVHIQDYEAQVTVSGLVINMARDNCSFHTNVCVYVCVCEHVCAWNFFLFPLFRFMHTFYVRGPF